MAACNRDQGKFQLFNIFCYVSFQIIFQFLVQIVFQIMFQIMLHIIWQNIFYRVGHGQPIIQYVFRFFQYISQIIFQFIFQFIFQLTFRFVFGMNIWTVLPSNYSIYFVIHVFQIIFQFIFQIICTQYLSRRALGSSIYIQSPWWIVWHTMIHTENTLSEIPPGDFQLHSSHKQRVQYITSSRQLVELEPINWSIERSTVGGCIEVYQAGCFPFGGSAGAKSGCFLVSVKSVRWINFKWYFILYFNLYFK